MTKALDARNEKARQLQLAKPNPQPFHKLYIDTERTCPFCNTRLRHAEGQKYWTQECDCSYWEQSDHPASFEWTREAKAGTIPATN